MSKPLLTQADFERAAKRLRCDVAAVKAVAEVESRGQGFYPDGFPVILFERHIFRKYTQGRYTKDHPDLSGPQGNYGKAGQHQRNKFSRAFALHPDAAMKACSWGKFQIMGFNFEVCGFSNVGEFVDAMKESEGRHLDAFISFVIGNGLGDELRTLNWANFARGYNGPTYAQNRYDTKMAAAYRKFKNSATTTKDSNEVPTAVDRDDTKTDTPLESATDPTDTPLPIKNEQDVNVPAQVSSTQYQGVGLFGVLKKDFAVVTGGNLSFQGIQEYATQASGWPPWVISIITKLATVAIIAGGAWLLYRLVHYVIWKVGDWQRMKVEANINSDVTRKNIEWS